MNHTVGPCMKVLLLRMPLRTAKDILYQTFIFLDRGFGERLFRQQA